MYYKAWQLHSSTTVYTSSKLDVFTLNLKLGNTEVGGGGNQIAT
jgi:hypothetical protein